MGPMHPFPDAAPAPLPETSLPDAAALRLRSVHRAVAELRRGTPVLLQDAQLPSAHLIVLAAETAGAGGLAELTAGAAGSPVLLVSSVRAASLLRHPVAPDSPVALRFPGLPDPDTLRGLADPTAEQPSLELQETAPPSLAAAALALAKLARLLPAVVAAPARADATEADPARFGLLAAAAADVLAYPAAAAAHLTRVADAHVPTEAAPDTRVVAFRTGEGGIEHLAILVGRPEDAPPDRPPLVRAHSECFTGDLLGSLRCDCGPQLHTALRRMREEGAGAVLYLAQEGRGIGLVNKLRAYALQDRGLDTLDANRALGWEADERSFLVAATMLRQLGIPRVRLLTNNPDKVAGLLACGVDVVAREALVVPANGVNDHYLATKARRFGHLLG